MLTISIDEASAKLPELIDNLSSGEQVTITRNGVPAGVLSLPAQVGDSPAPAHTPAAEPAVVHTPESRRIAREALLARVAEDSRRRQEAGKRPFRPVTNIRPGWVDEAVAEMRADRDAQ